MNHLAHARARAYVALIALPIGAACAQYPAISEYDFHASGIATILKVDYPAELHLRQTGDCFAGYYIVELPDYRLRRQFNACAAYYAQPGVYHGGGSSESLSYQDVIYGRVVWFDAPRTLDSVVVYDQFRNDTIPHFTGIRLEVHLIR
jgi:hypothetical protein